MSFSDISPQKRSFSNRNSTTSNNNNNNNNDNITQLSDSLQQFQKYCVVLKEKVTELRRRKCNQYEKNDIDMQIKELRSFESRLKTSIDTQLKSLEQGIIIINHLIFIIIIIIIIINHLIFTII